jgi:hypothetical protein
MVGGGSQLALGAAAALLEVSAADFWRRNWRRLEAATGPTASAPSWGCRWLPSRCMGTLIIAADARRELALASSALLDY